MRRRLHIIHAKIGHKCKHYRQQSHTVRGTKRAQTTHCSLCNAVKAGDAGSSLGNSPYRGGHNASGTFGRSGIIGPVGRRVG